MYGFLRTPRWVVGTVLAVVVVVTFVNLGLWQLRRLDERQARNALVEARMEAPLAPLAAVADPGFDAGHAVWRRVTAEGRYDPSREVLVRNRSLDGRPGFHVLTPLVIDGGASAVYVNRGWVPLQGDLDEPATGGPPPAGTVTLTGLLTPSQSRGAFGPRDPDAGVLDRLARADVDRLREQSPWPLYPVVLQLEEQAEPSDAELPVALPPPELSERNHLSYAVQWFLFSAIVAVGFPLLVRRTARQDPTPSDAPPVVQQVPQRSLS